MGIDKEYLARIRWVKRIKKKLSKVRLGLPKKVVFYFDKGTCTCFPKQRKWIIKPNGKKPKTYIVEPGNRLDVTKFKARNLLKITICNLLKESK